MVRTMPLIEELGLEPSVTPGVGYRVWRSGWTSRELRSQGLQRVAPGDGAQVQIRYAVMPDCAEPPPP